MATPAQRREPPCERSEAGLVAVVLGDVGFDDYAPGPATDQAGVVSPGGCALNVAVALAVAGWPGPVRPCAPLGPDGGPLRAIARARGLDPGLLEDRPAPSPRQRIVVREGGERDFTGGYAPGALAGWTPDPAARAALAGADLVYVAAFDATAHLLDLLAALRPGGGGRATAVDCMTLADVGLDAALAALARRWTVVCGLEADLDGSGRDAAAIAALEAAATASGADLVVTLGPRGCRASLGGERVAQPAAPVPGGRVVDTTGCGDAFAGTLLAARARGLVPREAVARAAEAAARCAARLGALDPGPS